jgi:hypothetical protein
MSNIIVEIIYYDDIVIYEFIYCNRLIKFLEKYSINLYTNSKMNKFTYDFSHTEINFAYEYVTFYTIISKEQKYMKNLKIDVTNNYQHCIEYYL